MNNKEFKYDAFISYRHCELDKYVAENLHKILENYELPKAIKNKLNVQGRTFKRLFRDQEELPLSSNLEDPIIDALKGSKFLIVICSPRLKDSMWCKKEIQTFKKLRGRKNILCVLVEGEPSESFPEEVLYDEVEVKQKNGKTKKEKIMVEPLAADVRGINKSEVLKKIKSEKLRLVASMYNIDYDDLKQRHKIRKQKRIIAIASAIASFCLLFALYTSFMLIKINKQKNTLREHQALSLSSKAIDYLLEDDRYNAVKSSYEALTKFDGVKMPYTTDAEYALVESLGLYDVGSTYKAISTIKTDGVADDVKINGDGKYAAVYDEAGVITLFDSSTMKVISKYNVDSRVANSEYFSFIGNDILSFINKKGNVVLVNVKDGKTIKEFKRDDEVYISVHGDMNGKYLAYMTNKVLYIYNVIDNKNVGSFETNEKFVKEMFFSADGEYLFVGSTRQEFSVTKEDALTMHVISSNDCKEINKEIFKAGYISGIVTKGNNAYMLLNNAFGTDFNMLIVSYDYINDNVNWSKSYDNLWGKFIIHSNYDKVDNIAVVSYNAIKIINAKNGEIVLSTNAATEIIDIYSYFDREVYTLFLSDGAVNFLSVDANDILILNGKFEFNLPKYSKVAQTKNGYLMIPLNENRVILYEAKVNKDMKELDTKLDYIKDDSINVTKIEELTTKYSIKNKNLVERIFYDDKKELLFVNYTNKDVAIYNAKTKEHLKTLSNVGNVYHYFGKDKYGRLYIGDLSDSYILDKNYNKVGHIKGLAKLDKDKVTILYNSKFYSIKIYDLDSALDIAKKYLDQK